MTATVLSIALVRAVELSPVFSETQRNARNATNCVRKVRKKRNKRKKITQSKTLRKNRFPSKRNARNRQPIGMVDLNSQSSKQPIKCLRCLRFSCTQRNRLRCVRCV